jgi:hypothetical protein
MFIRNGKKEYWPDSPITVGGVTYPNLRDPATRALLGVTEVPDPVMPDLRYNYVSENEDGSLVITPKPQEQLDQMLQGERNTTCMQYLASTDWYVTRFAETGEAVPPLVLAARSEARAAIIHVPKETP